MFCIAQARVSHSKLNNINTNVTRFFLFERNYTNIGKLVLL
uniref:Uncharacterized protein n=1 Tax=Rhizophora mucronata TaxID=61149 RepID=A0A2P2Q277_RHIMU